MHKLTATQKSIILATFAIAGFIALYPPPYYLRWDMPTRYVYMDVASLLNAYVALAFIASAVFLIVTWGVIGAVWRWIVRYKVIVLATLIPILIAATFFALYQCGVFDSWNIAVRPVQQSTANAGIPNDLVPVAPSHKRDVFDDLDDQAHKNTNAARSPFADMPSASDAAQPSNSN